MHFPSLAVFTTLACAAFSIAAPLTNVENAIEHVPRDTDVASPLVVALTSLSTDLQPALAALVKVAEGKVTVEVDSNTVKDAVVNVVTVITVHVEDIKQAALASVGNLQTLVVGKLLVDIITAVYTALDAVASVKAVASGVLDPLVNQITAQLAEVTTVVQSIVPEAISLVQSQIKSLYTQVVTLNLAYILTTLGVEAPV